LISIAQESQRSNDEYHIAQAAPQRTEFPINSYVLVQYRERPPTKLHMNWRGPMRVINYTQNVYTLQDLVTNKNVDYHVSQLKAFEYDPLEVDPTEIAMREAQEFVVESILDHSGTPAKRSEMKFLVHWSGFDQTHDSWEPWENVRNTRALHNYLFHNKLKSLLTAEQKAEVIENRPIN
jgi:hypothetical protein